MPLINCEIELILTWSKDCVMSSLNGETKFAITETKLYVPVVALSTEDNAKLLQQLKSNFRRKLIYTFAQNRYLNYLINLSFQGVNTSHSTYYLPKVEIKDYNVMIDTRNVFDQPINGMNKTYENIRKIAIGKADDYTAGGMLDYSCFKENYKTIAIDLSKQQALDADPRKIQQINFTANLDRAGNATIFFVIKQEKETSFEFSQGTVKIL